MGLSVWDAVLMVVVTGMATLLAYFRSPGWKAFMMGLPFPFTFATLSLGQEVGTGSVVGLAVLLLFTHGVRIGHVRLKWPIVPVIVLCAAGYCALAVGLNRLLPRSEIAFWAAVAAVFALGVAAFRLMPAVAEPDYRSPLPLAVKIPAIAAVVALLVLIKAQIGGFMATFPMVGVISAYEARHSLNMACRQIAVVLFGMSAMMAVIRLAHGWLSPLWPGRPGLAAALAAGWLVYLAQLAILTRGRWILSAPRAVPAKVPLALLLLIGAAGLAFGREPAAVHFDGTGRLRLLTAGGAPIPVTGEIRVAGPDWRFYGASSPWSATGVTFAAVSGESTWIGRIPLEHGGRARYEQRVRERSGGADLSLRVTAENDFLTEGAHYYLQLPARTFAESVITLLRGTAVVARAVAPALHEPGRNPRFLSAPSVDGMRIESAAEGFTLEVSMGAPRALLVQDDREWGAPHYSVAIPLLPGPEVRSGASGRLLMEIRVTGGTPDRTPARIRLAEKPTEDAFEGFGGNFVYGLEGPVATGLIARLEPVRARIELPLHEWEPENDNESPAETDWAKLEARDVAGSPLRARFELARLLAERGVPLTISLWDMPEWMYEGPPRGRWVARRTVAPAMWPEAVEGITSYLLHLKNRYGVEPAYFSFNEPETGVRVLLTAAQHRDAIVRLGDRFEAMGLKTRLLAGDVADPRGTESYCVYALTDPVAARRIGAAAFHSWGGAAPAEYRDWTALARRFRLPLDVTELGWDAAAWRTPHELRTPYYTIQEARMTLELLAHARPRSVLLWEYSNDYPLLMEGADGMLEETARFRFFERLIRTTPRPSRHLPVSCSRQEIAAAAFQGSAGAPVLHLVNPGGVRTAEIEGLPASLVEVTVRAIRADGADEPSRRLPVRDGRVTVDLPAWSLVTVSE